MPQSDDTIFMLRCLELAARAEGFTSPNPMVGAVIVSKGRIIGEGYHLRAGAPHAESVAINAVSDRALLSESTLYVNLEPCSHHGRTPPCADMVISSGIRRVVVGTRDTSAKVAGKGIEKMKTAGIEVVTGIEENKCRFLNRRFFTWHEKNRPYVILKWARSADGFIDLDRKPGEISEPHWITGMSERALVHRWRASEDAILVGGATVRADNPGLDVRYWKGKNPVRIIISRSGRIDTGAKVLDGKADTLIFTRGSHASVSGVSSIVLEEKQEIIETVLRTIHEMEIQSVLVEGGAFIISKFISSGLWDEARRFTGFRKFVRGVPEPYPEMTPERHYTFSSSFLDISFNAGYKSLFPVHNFVNK